MKNWHKPFQPEKARAFFQHAFASRVELVKDMPRVLISRAAYNAMWHYVDIASQEIGWLGTCCRQGNDFLIEEVFLFKQEVSHVSTEITADGLAEMAQELISSRPDGVEVCNSLRFWGHSHVNMGTSPSGQDDSQMDVFQESRHSFFVRAILNKQGRMEFTIYLYESGVKIVDAEWQIHEPADQNLREGIEAEFKAKISQARYGYAGLGYDQYNGDRVIGSIGLHKEENLYRPADISTKKPKKGGRKDGN